MPRFFLSTSSTPRGRWRWTSGPTPPTPTDPLLQKFVTSAHRLANWPGQTHPLGLGGWLGRKSFQRERPLRPEPRKLPTRATPEPQKYPTPPTPGRKSIQHHRPLGTKVSNTTDPCARMYPTPMTPEPPKAQNSGFYKVFLAFWTRGHWCWILSDCESIQHQ